MTDLDPTTTYFLRRAKNEEVRAISADDPAVAAAHHGLSVLHSAKALLLIAKKDLEPSLPASADRHFTN